MFNRYQNKYQDIIEHLWENPQSQDDLMTEPKSYLQKQGLKIPENVEVLVHQGKAEQLYLILPPDGTEMSQSDDLGSKMVARAMQDSAYKALLQKNPQAAAREMGVELPDSMTIVVLQDSEDRMHCLIPFNPSSHELSEADLEAVAGGGMKAVVTNIEELFGNGGGENSGGLPPLAIIL